MLIEDSENRELLKPILEFEKKNAIWSLQADKAPVPNGFTINFYKVVWEIIKEDMKRILIGLGKNIRSVGPQTHHSYP